MFEKKYALLVAALLMLVSLGITACAASAEAAASPQMVVESFYSWALEYTAFNEETGERANPMVDGAYIARPEISAAMIDSYEATRASFEPMGGGYDPFLCAQDIPTTFRVGETVVEGDQALVTVETSFANHSFQVELTREAGEWLISDVFCSFGK